MKRLISSILLMVIASSAVWSMTPPRPRPTKSWATLSDAELGRKLMTAERLCESMRESARRAVIVAEVAQKLAMLEYAARLSEDTLAMCRTAQGLYKFMENLDKEEAVCAAGGKCSPRSLERIQSMKEAQAAGMELTGETQEGTN